FRFFDILKPAPIRAINDRMYGGLGVVMDDIVAGIYTNVIIYVLRRLMIA
ncbi:MAG: phosphatidylglycerophosphatase A, partial [Thermodesulfobacteriota bacterium]|nr:phosphatidylglycerophosphatase A [Thermodesulfobacteriota bacterium]